MRHLHRKLSGHCPTTVQLPVTAMEIDYFSLLHRCVGRARTRETKIKGQPDGARPESNLTSQPFSERGPKQTPQGQEQVKHLQNFTPAPGPQGLSEQDSCAFSSTPRFLAQWDCSTEMVRQNAVGIREFHRTAAEKVKQTWMNVPQKAT